MEKNQGLKDTETPLASNIEAGKPSEAQKDGKSNPLAWDRNFEELLDLSGVEKQIKNFDELLKKQLDFDMGSQDGPAWTKIMAKHFKSKFILAEIRKEFKNIPPDELKSMVESFNDPLMKKVSKLEELATASEAQEQFEEFSSDYDNQPPNAEREKLIKSIDQLSGSTENTVSMVMAMMKGAQVGQNAELPQSEKIPPEFHESSLIHPKDALHATLPFDATLSATQPSMCSLAQGVRAQRGTNFYCASSTF